MATDRSLDPTAYGYKLRTVFAAMLIFAIIGTGIGTQLVWTPRAMPLTLLGSDMQVTETGTSEGWDGHNQLLSEDKLNNLKSLALVEAGNLRRWQLCDVELDAEAEILISSAAYNPIDPKGQLISASQRKLASALREAAEMARQQYLPCQSELGLLTVSLMFKALDDDGQTLAVRLNQFDVVPSTISLLNERGCPATQTGILTDSSKTKSPDRVRREVLDKMMEKQGFGKC